VLSYLLFVNGDFLGSAKNVKILSEVCPVTEFSSRVLIEELVEFEILDVKVPGLPAGIDEWTVEQEYLPSYQ
jgi:hypothetical protein